MEITRGGSSDISGIKDKVDLIDGQKAHVMAIKTDRLGTAFTFFIFSKLYGVMEVSGISHQWFGVQLN